MKKLIEKIKSKFGRKPVLAIPAVSGSNPHPSLNEDKRDCRLWKPQHWNWFLGYYH